ncbi:MAG: hypothetical protein Tsb005_17420 [Gammaproteobacteria bacterium]
MGAYIVFALEKGKNAVSLKKYCHFHDKFQEIFRHAALRAAAQDDRAFYFFNATAVYLLQVSFLKFKHRYH